MIEIIFSGIILILLVLLLNPFEFWMPDSMHMAILVGLVIAFSLFAMFVYREKANDEREVLLRFIAGRFAYLVGTTMLVIGIVVEALNHVINMWLILTLGVMILAKIVGVFYGKLKY